jgi:quinoprotein glucose dehydrogenase
MPETPVPQSDVPGEKTSATQPIPTKPPPYARTHVTVDEVIDFTPALRATALENLKKFRGSRRRSSRRSARAPYVLGAINVGNTVGGINWPGASFDPETGHLLRQANNSSVTTDDHQRAVLRDGESASAGGEPHADLGSRAAAES